MRSSDVALHKPEQMSAVNKHRCITLTTQINETYGENGAECGIVVTQMRNFRINSETVRCYAAATFN